LAQLKRSGSRPSRPVPRAVTLARDLQRRKGRERRSLFLAEGVRTVEEVVRARVGVRAAIVSPQLEESPRGRSLLEALERRADETVRVPARELNSLADTDSPQGVLVIAEIPTQPIEGIRLAERARVVVLDGVQDPGNAGTIARTAAALGSAAVIALPGTVDLWNPKVVRGAMGAHFHIPTLHAEPDELLAWLDAQKFEIWAADARGEPLESLPVPERVAIVVGNEGAGISSQMLERASRRVALPLSQAVESLNVAVAAGIILYALGAASPRRPAAGTGSE
jgi:RNA methyltransferase, TrmH family